MRFLELLLVVTLIISALSSIGALGYLYQQHKIGIGAVLSGAAVSSLLIVAAYGIYRDRTWGYLLALALLAVGIACDMLLNSLAGVMMNAVLFGVALVALATRSRGARLTPPPPEQTAPPPSMAMVSMLELPPRRRFVRRRS